MFEWLLNIYFRVSASQVTFSDHFYANLYDDSSSGFFRGKRTSLGRILYLPLVFFD